MSAWSAWWIRVLLLIIHLALLGAAASLTPGDYFFRLGEVTGLVILPGTLFLWFILWHAKQRNMVLLFCGLALAQTALVAVVATGFRTEDRAVRAIGEERTQRQKVWAAQMASFHLERIFEVLAPGSQIHAEELPTLLDQVRKARANDTEQWRQMQAWADDAEKRLSGVNLQAAKEFRRGFESTRARNEKFQELNKEFFAEVEELLSMLIARQGHYHSTQNGLAFDQTQDADTYDKVLSRLTAMKEKINAELPPL